MVSIEKNGCYAGLEIGDDPALEEDLAASVAHKLSLGRLAGFVVEGLVPYGLNTSAARHSVLLRATACGIPVARVGRGHTQGFADYSDYQISGANLTATKARLLLMACLLRFGSLPPAADPDSPTDAELAAIRDALAQYQAVFDTH